MNFLSENTELGKQALKKFKAVFENTNDAMIFTDDNGKYLEVNPMSCELFGLPVEELLTHSFTDFADLTSPEAANAWKEFLQTGHQMGRFQLHIPDGKIKIIEYFSKANVLLGKHLFILKDVTLQEQSGTMKEDLEILKKATIKRELKMQQLKQRIDRLNSSE